MTRAEQDTERALVRAETEFLKARGWTVTVGGLGSSLGGSVRLAHESLKGGPTDYCLRDAMALTRAEPLRFRRRS